jgi:hypothetical protein
VSILALRPNRHPDDELGLVSLLVQEPIEHERREQASRPPPADPEDLTDDPPEPARLHPKSISP